MSNVTMSVHEIDLRVSLGDGFRYKDLCALAAGCRPCTQNTLVKRAEGLFARCCDLCRLAVGRVDRTPADGDFFVLRVYLVGLGMGDGGNARGGAFDRGDGDNDNEDSELLRAINGTLRLFGSQPPRDTLPPLRRCAVTSAEDIRRLSPSSAFADAVFALCPRLDPYRTGRRRVFADALLCPDAPSAGHEDREALFTVKRRLYDVFHDVDAWGSAERSAYESLFVCCSPFGGARYLRYEMFYTVELHELFLTDARVVALRGHLSAWRRYTREPSAELLSSAETREALTVLRAMESIVLGRLPFVECVTFCARPLAHVFGVRLIARVRPSAPVFLRDATVARLRLRRAASRKIRLALSEAFDVPLCGGVPQRAVRRRLFLGPYNGARLRMSSAAEGFVVAGAEFGDVGRVCAYKLFWHRIPYAECADDAELVGLLNEQLQHVSQHASQQAERQTHGGVQHA